MAYQESLTRKRPSNEPSVSVIEKSVLNETLDASVNRSISSNDNTNTQDTLHMLINKQLSSSSLKSKQIGVIGALMLIKNLAKHAGLADSNKDDSRNTTLTASQSEDFFSCNEIKNC